MPAVDWQENYIPEPNSGCWLWLGALSVWGYGVVYPKGRRGGQHRVHRLFYELHNGPIPQGLQACHRCDNTMCCNPDHIFIGTAADNALDKKMKGRVADQSGERGNNARLTWQDIAVIRASSEPQIALAKLYGIHPSAISRIKNGKRWRDAGKSSH